MSSLSNFKVNIMAKPGIEEENPLETLSTDLSSGLPINEHNLSPEMQINNLSESASAVTNVLQVEPEESDEEIPNEFYEDSYDLMEDFEYPLQSKSASIHIKTSKEKPRIRQKDYNIIAKRNNTTKLPSHFKFDRATTTILEMVMEFRHVGEYHHTISKGLSSVVIHAHCYGRYHTYFPHGNAVKVYKVTNDADKNIAIYKKVQREHDHLVILRNQHYGNNFPHPVCFYENVIVMSFIGTDQESATSISTLAVDFKELYKSIIKEIDAWYNKLNLVHGNLSGKSILYYQDIPHFVGWSHSVPKDHPRALIKLIKDCHFITKFFENKDVPVKSTEELFKNITGIDKLSNKLLDIIEDKNLWKNQQPNPNKGKKLNSSNGQSRFKQEHMKVGRRKNKS